MLVGMMGSGKSTVADLLAARAGCPLHRLDDRIVEQAGKGIAAIFAEDGEERFRALESEALAVALAAPAGVVDTGGGITEFAANRKQLCASTTDRCYLDATAEVVLARLGAGTARPMLVGADLPARVRELLCRRDAGYREVATLVVATKMDDTPATTMAQVSEEVGWCAA